MVFNDTALFTVIVYSVLFVIAACGNLTVFITLFRNRHRRSRVNLFILHLSTADLIVTFIMMPLEIAWNITVGNIYSQYTDDIEGLHFHYLYCPKTEIVNFLFI